jgi:nucleoside-diphosphate-sugar epimerase
MQVFLTGGSGFVGRHLLGKLLAGATILGGADELSLK